MTEYEAKRIDMERLCGEFFGEFSEFYQALCTAQPKFKEVGFLLMGIFNNPNGKPDFSIFTNMPEANHQDLFRLMKEIGTELVDSDTKLHPAKGD